MYYWSHMAKQTFEWTTLPTEKDVQVVLWEQSNNQYFGEPGSTWSHKTCRHFIKEKLEKKIISLPLVRSKDQLADILTKVVTSEAFEWTLCKLVIGERKT